MKRNLIPLCFFLLILSASANLWAGGSGLNVVVVVNQNSTNSVQLGNYYREQRNVPPQNFLRIAWPGTNTEWTLTDFNNTLLTPLLTMLSSRQLTNQIDYVVLSMDIPYRVTSGSSEPNSTTSALFYGFKTDLNPPCSLVAGSANLYAGSEGIFRSTPPISASSNSFLVTMITANTLAVSKMVVQQGVLGDGTFPTQTVWFGKSTDASRNVRYSTFDNSVFNTRLRGDYTVLRTNIGSPNFSGLILGYENGSYSFSTSPTPLFVPGAMADNLTSASGQIFQDTAGQTTLSAFLAAGASGSYGTVTEPCNYLEKFPDPQNHFYQARGFSLGECYYQSLTNPYQGLVAGEPLAAPFAQPASGAWLGLISNAVLSGLTNLPVHFTASDARHPVQQLDLFVDGAWLQTVTNIPPQSGNVLNVSLNGFATSYTVPASATIKSVTSNLTGVLNGAAYQNNTKVLAIAHGDRIELQSIAAYTKTGAQIPVSGSSTNPSGALTTFIQAAGAGPFNFLDTAASGVKVFELSGTPQMNDQLTFTVTKTNNAVVTVTVTNTTGGNTMGNFAQQLLTAINNTASLQGADGLAGGDLQTGGTLALFDFLANSPGYAAAQIRGALSGSPSISVFSNSGATLTDNTSDLEPRNHLYITAGVSSLAVTIPFNTTSQPDGYHELAAIAYEGSHVRTQARATQYVIIKNTPLSATLTPLLTGTNSALQVSLQIAVAANTNNIATIQLFSTGGLLAVVSNQTSATFSITLTNLGIGLHPFYAIVTDNLGRQYRTQAQTIGLIGVSYAGATLIGVDYPFPVRIGAPPPMLVWPATAGRSYNVQSTTNLTTPYQTRAMVIPTNSLGHWTEINTTPGQQFYRVSVAP